MKKFLVLVVVVVAIWVIVSSFGSAKPTDMTNDMAADVSTPIKLGFIGALTGDVAALGQNSQKAVQYAVKQINDNGGINGQQVEMVYEDGGCKAQTASNAANKLLNVDKVSAIVGGLCSGETSAFAKVANDMKVPVVTYCSSAPALSQTGKYFFRTYPSDAFQGRFAAEYAYNVLKAKNVAVITSTSDWGNGLRDKFEARFKELGGKIVFTENTPDTNREFKTQLAKIKAAKPDLVYAALYSEAGGAFVAQYADAKLTTPIYGGDAWADTNFQKAVPATLKVYFSESKTNISSDFKTAYTATGGELTACAPQAYDAVQVVAKGITNAKSTDGDAVATAIRALNFVGVSGQINYDQNGDLTVAEYVVKKIEKGVATEVK